MPAPQDLLTATRTIGVQNPVPVPPADRRSRPEVAARVLGRSLSAVFAIGSLAPGGFAPLVSDVELVLVVSRADRVRDPDGNTWTLQQQPGGD